MKDAMGFVWLKGMTKSGTVTGAVFTLPAGYRPVKGMYLPTVSNNVFGLMEVGSDGVVKLSIGSNLHFSLDLISFKAA